MTPVGDWGTSRGGRGAPKGVYNTPLEAKIALMQCDGTFAYHQLLGLFHLALG